MRVTFDKEELPPTDSWSRHKVEVYLIDSLIEVVISLPPLIEFVLIVNLSFLFNSLLSLLREWNQQDKNCET